jgi:hypothetical protein
MQARASGDVTSLREGAKTQMHNSFEHGTSITSEEYTADHEDTFSQETWKMVLTRR